MTAPTSLLPRVLVCHPGRQHSHQLAMALAERGMLAQYVAGTPLESGNRGGKWQRLLRGIVRPSASSFDPKLVTTVYVASVPRKVAVMMFSPAIASAIGHRADGLFDRYVCRYLSTLRPDAVVAYENSALHTFRRARQLGIKTILDAASVHHRWQDRFLSPAEGEISHRRTTRRKDAEVALADQILTVSELARESYLEAGVPHDRVHAIPVGVDSRRFQPIDRGASGCNAVEGNFRFIYVGNASRAKGIDVLCEAVGRLRAAGERLTMTLIGVSDASPIKEPSDGIIKRGWMNHDLLAAELPQHDVFVLPSFFDSFGMVVAEAMASGLPVIVTQNVGAREMISPGVNGLIVAPGDATALAEAMKWFMANRERLAQMSRASRESAERYDWVIYRRRVAEFLAAI